MYTHTHAHTHARTHTRAHTHTHTHTHTPVKSWNALIRTGSWLKDSAGGCRNYPTFTSNPQFPIYLDEDDDGDGKCSCLIALMQKNRRKQKKMGIQELCIGFSLYKVCLLNVFS